ncbi:MAG: 2-amino-4-hydroxy-6-hydroxymethyldihydropteridine diphosphokinase [Candidatus Kaiserbacteria bacterium]|nr:2-amino-4-hydroxy-6-hydroxymethyldihydropteridine diphosphokinase [Candidatus Kaiserbacteria bacterium]
MTFVYLGLGSNLGDRVGNLRRAIDMLGRRLTLEKMSSIYETKPHGVEGEQPLYLNMAIGAKTDLQPLDLLLFAHSIERELGREKNSHALPRVIDIDILLYGEEVIDTRDLTVPHARMHERAFVLVPLEEIASFEIHPTLKKPIVDVLDELGDTSEIIWQLDERL